MKLSKSMKKRIIFCLMAAACGVGAVGLYTMKPSEKIQKKQPVPPRQVTVRQVTPAERRSVIRVYGEVTARWTSVLRARVEGRIITINDALQPGQRLCKGDTLLQVDPTDYQAGLARARMELATAQEELIRAEQEANQARINWKNAGIKEPPASLLVFHLPQVKAAHAKADLAQKNMDKARNDLDQTRITAPYDCLVAECFVNKGETLFSGDRVLTVLSADNLEISVTLDQAQTHALGKWEKTAVTLQYPATGKTWAGKVVRDGQMMDKKTRLRRFYLIPLGKRDGLVPGMFVIADLQGSENEPLLALPESALTRDGLVWLVDQENMLRSLAVQPVFYEKGQVFIKAQKNQGPLQVVVTPTPSFIAGTQVIPVIQDGDELR